MLPSCACQTVCFAYPPSSRKDKRPRKVRSGIVEQCRGDYRDRNAPGACFFGIDIGRRNRHGRNHAQARIGSNDVAVDTIMQQAKENVVIMHRREQFFLRRNVQRIGIDVDFADFAQSGDCALCHRLRDEYTHRLYWNPDNRTARL